VDPLREELLDAAARVIARQGYAGTKIQDIVREAGLSSGAVYGRFRGKEELVREAIITRATRGESEPVPAGTRVADLVAKGISEFPPRITDAEALLVESYLTASRDPVIAEALAETDRRWRRSAAATVDAAVRDGSIAEDIDPQAVLFLVRILRLGLLLHCGSGLPFPDQSSWEHLMSKVMASFGSAHAAAE
jgi:AcrR family transcriptional regulator